MIGYGNSVFLRTAWEVSGGVPPVNTVAPAITGTAQEGQTVSCSTGTWTGTPTITFAYQWKRNGSNIGSATNSTYTLVTADVSQSITCQVTATNGSGSASATSNTITPIAAVDPDAQAFITAAGITNPTQQGAINTLVVDLKGYSIWTKFKAIYPIVGGTASSHAVNLKTPGTFNLTFSTGWTHSSTGMTPNGTSAFANTGLNTSTQLNVNSHSFGMYSRTNNTTGSQAIGSFDNTPRFLQNNLSLGNFVSGLVSSIITYTANPSTSLLMLSRTSSTLSKAFRGGVLLGQETVTMGTLPTFNFYLGARNDAGVANLYSLHQCAFASIGDGLTDTDAANFYTAVQAYQTTLSRQV
jgi:hypothetical protein